MYAIDIKERFLQGPRDWERFLHGRWPLRVSSGFALPYPWFALGISFGRYVLRRFRFSLSFVRVRCLFGRSAFAVVPSYDIVG